MTINNIVSCKIGTFRKTRLNYFPTPEKALKFFDRDFYRHVQELIDQGISNGSIRVNEEGFISIYDFIKEVLDKKSPRRSWMVLVKRFPEIYNIIADFTFPGQGQRPTPVCTRQHLLSICAVIPNAESVSLQKELESDVVTSLNLDYSQKEVLTPLGKIDVLTPNYLIEVKHIRDCVKAIGQVIAYGSYFPKHDKLILVFGIETDSDKKKYREFECVCREQNIVTLDISNIEDRKYLTDLF